MRIASDLAWPIMINDGDQDFYMTTLTENQLFRNDGGQFVEVAAEAGVAGDPAWSTSVLFFDADNDGWLDLYVGNYVSWTPETDLFCTHDGTIKGYCTPEIYDGVKGRYYRNNGDGTFTDQTEENGFGDATGIALGLLAFDYNRDGWTDVMIANDTRPDELFVNTGEGVFVEQGAQSGLAYDEKGRARAGMGVDAGVVDTTGQETVFVGNFSREMIGVYRYSGKGYFNDRAAQSRIGRTSLLTLTFGLFLADFDLDTDLDLFAANGHVQPDIETFLDNVKYAEPAHVFLNDGNGYFEDVAPIHQGALGVPLVARGAAFADTDQDGDVDILVAENGRGARLWRNETNSKDYLRVQLEGSRSNRNGLGSRVILYSNQQRQERFVRSGSSYLAASEQIVTFGLGSISSVDSLVVYWPSGNVSVRTAMEAGQTLTLVEGASYE